MRHLTKKQRTELAVLLRYKTLTPRRFSCVYGTLKEIADILGCSVTWVYKACMERRETVETFFTTKGTKRRPKASMPVHFKWKRYLYSEEHRTWLTNPGHLQM